MNFFTDYKDKLMDFQVEGATFLSEKHRGILGDEMGVGKTRQAIAASLKLGSSIVVFCPAAGDLKNKWGREVLNFDEEAHIEIIDGTKCRVFNEGMGTRWLIVNYDVIGREKNREKILEYMPGILIMDEAHYIKNSKSKRTKEALKYAQVALAVFLLTGTPVLNRPMELFTLLQAIQHPITLKPNAWYVYARRYCGGRNVEFYRTVLDPATNKYIKRRFKFLETKGATNLEELKKHIDPYYLRRTKAVLGDKLPEKIITNIDVEIPKEYQKKYESAWGEYITKLILSEDTQNEDIINAQLAQHIIELNKIKQIVSLGKIDTIIKDIENIVEQDEKVIVFTQYTETLDTIVERVRGKKIGVMKIDGRDKANEREHTVKSFQEDSETKVLVGNIKAAGIGIDLTAASTVLFADMEWTPAVHQQAEDRAHRYGQKRMVNVYYYVGKGTVDEDILEMLDRKSQVISRILEGEDNIGKQDITKQTIKKIIDKQQVINK